MQKEGPNGRGKSRQSQGVLGTDGLAVGSAGGVGTQKGENGSGAGHGSPVPGDVRVACSHLDDIQYQILGTST